MFSSIQLHVYMEVKENENENGLRGKTFSLWGKCFYKLPKIRINHFLLGWVFCPVQKTLSVLNTKHLQRQINPL